MYQAETKIENDEHYWKKERNEMYIVKRERKYERRRKRDRDRKRERSKEE